MPLNVLQKHSFFLKKKRNNYIGLFSHHTMNLPYCHIHVLFFFPPCKQFNSCSWHFLYPSHCSGGFSQDSFIISLGSYTRLHCSKLFITFLHAWHIIESSVDLAICFMALTLMKLKLLLVDDGITVLHSFEVYLGLKLRTWLRQVAVIKTHPRNLAG